MLFLSLLGSSRCFFRIFFRNFFYIFRGFFGTCFGYSFVLSFGVSPILLPLFLPLFLSLLLPFLLSMLLSMSVLLCVCVNVFYSGIRYRDCKCCRKSVDKSDDKIVGKCARKLFVFCCFFCAIPANFFST